MTEEAKIFHIGVILSITGDALMSPTQPPISGVYSILNHMTKDDLYTHQLIRARDECRPWLLKQHPALAEWREEVNPENYREKLALAVERFGEFLSVDPVPEHEHQYIDPLSELAEKVHPDKIVMVPTDALSRQPKDEG